MVNIIILLKNKRNAPIRDSGAAICPEESAFAEPRITLDSTEERTLGVNIATKLPEQYNIHSFPQYSKQ